MKVEVLYVADCPYYPAAVNLVKDLLAEQGVSAEIHEILVRDQPAANELRFPGSPTIRINGRDIAGVSTETQSFALSCRLYAGSKQPGLPPKELVRRAVAEVREEGQT